LAEWTPFQIRFFLENLEVPGIEPGTSGTVARNCDHWTTEAVEFGGNVYHMGIGDFKSPDSTVFMSNKV
jgi:hypothetical protein